MFPIPFEEGGAEDEKQAVSSSQPWGCLSDHDSRSAFVNTPINPGSVSGSAPDHEDQGWEWDHHGLDRVGPEHLLLCVSVERECNDGIHFGEGRLLLSVPDLRNRVSFQPLRDQRRHGDSERLGCATCRHQLGRTKRDGRLKRRRRRRIHLPASDITPVLSGGNVPSGHKRCNFYVYDATFTLQCTTKVTMSGTMKADNLAGVFLNGNFIKKQATGAGFSYDGVNPPAANFGAGTAFGPVPLADFVVGLNTVDFVVWDSTEPATGLDFKFVVKVSCPGGT